MIRFWGFLFVAIIISLVWSFSTSARAEGQEFCNETSYILYTAIAFPEQTSLVAKGWTRLRPGQCRVLIPAPVPPGEYFVFARSSDAHRGGIRQWSGPTPICVDQTDFSVSGLANCESLGLETRNFRIIDANAPKGRKTIFTEANDHGKRAILAGLQRLLKDNGLNIRKIDGYSGRRTRLAIRKYLKKSGIKNRPSDPEFIDMLEKSARSLKQTSGLQVCNEAEGTVWTAYARWRNKQWQSRGWWAVEPDTCVQLVNEPLQKREKYYLYAGLINPKGESPLADATETFCVSEVRFAIPGRHDCKSRGYTKAKFRKVNLTKSSLINIRLAAEDFAGHDSFDFYRE